MFINRDGLIVRERMPMSFTESGEKVRALMVLDLVDLGSEQDIDLPVPGEAIDITEEAAGEIGG